MKPEARFLRRGQGEPWPAAARAERTRVATALLGAQSLALALAVVLREPASLVNAAGLGSALFVMALAAWALFSAEARSEVDWILLASLVASSVTSGVFAARYGGFHGMGVGTLITTWSAAALLVPRRSWRLAPALLIHVTVFAATLRLAGVEELPPLNAVGLVAAAILITVTGAGDGSRRWRSAEMLWGQIADVSATLDSKRAALTAARENLQQVVRARVEEALAHAQTSEQLDRLLAERVAIRSRKLAQAVDQRGRRGSDPLSEGVVCGGARILGRMAPAPYERCYVAADDVTPGRVLIVMLESASAPAVIERLSVALGRLALACAPNVRRIEPWGDSGIAILWEQRPGRLLVHALARPDLTLPEALQLALGLADTLACAHAAGCLHLGFDPHRIVLGRRGMTVYGLGLLQAWYAVGGSEEDASQILANPAYRAPEAQLSPAMDVYALGVVVFELLARVHPFVARVSRDGGNAAETIAALQPGAPREVRNLVASMLAANPARRPTMAVVRATFAEAVGVRDLENVCLRFSGTDHRLSRTG